MSENYYPDLSPVKTGAAGKCPRCGRGNLFKGYLSVAKSCASCGLSFEFADGGDGAAWFVMLIVSVVGVGSILGIEVAYAPPYWVHALVAVPLLIILPMLLLRPVKGILLCQQWKTDAREGRKV
ncbi:MAG: DUF983 domain-containing protein [Alphaproteobacteria bacterium]|nr:DUF983 domain-containing protein [Alphaproteobacteria bacterium]